MSVPALTSSKSAELNEPTFSPAAPDVLDIVGILRRGWWILAGMLLLGSALGLLFTSMLAPTYRAQARLVLESSVNRYLQSSRVADGPSLGDESWSQVHVVASEAVILPVIDKLNLTEDSEFGVNKGAGEPGLRALITGKIKSIISAAGSKRDSAPPKDSPRMATYRAITEKLYVNWEAQPLVMNVTFTSRDAAKAALIANEIADSYIKTSLDSKRHSARLATQSLQNRLADLRDQAAQAERQLLEFRAANHVTRPEPGSPAADQAAGISANISSARVAMHDARARLEVVQRTSRSGDRSAADTPLLGRLREQLVEITSRADDMETRVGKGHAAARQLRKRQSEILAAMEVEQKRLTNSFAVEYEVARARFEELNSAAMSTITDDSANSALAARARELDSAAQTFRSMYTSLLQRVNEDNRLVREMVVLPDARILWHASVPQQTESSKKRLFVLAGSSSLGLLFGGLFLFLRNNPIGVFRTPGQISTVLGLKPVVVPSVETGHWHQAKSSSPHVTDGPHSRFAEAFRTIWARLKTDVDKPRVVAVVSSVEGEGKTTVAINLAEQAAMQSGVRTLLIDADLRHQTLTRALAPNAKHGLKEALDDPQRLSEYIVKDSERAYDVLPCPLHKLVPNAAQLLGSAAMERLIKQLRESYDLVLIEVPPAAAVPDFMMISPLCDALVFVVEWGATSQRLVLETVADVAGTWDRVACVVLNKVKPSALKSIELYKGKSYGSYFK